MPLDIELSELSAGGATAPRADWTKSAREHLGNAIAALVANAGASTSASPADLMGEESRYLQVFKLHETIGSSILQYQAGGPDGSQPILPTLKKTFDWTLGDSVQPLGEFTSTSHALLVFVRDSYATAGRKAAIAGAIVACGLTGVCIPLDAGRTIAFASLVDLKTGELIWFNVLRSSIGDLRKAKPAAELAEDLLKDLPL